MSESRLALIKKAYAKMKSSRAREIAEDLYMLDSIGLSEYRVPEVSKEAVYGHIDIAIV